MLCSSLIMHPPRKWDRLLLAIDCDQEPQGNVNEYLLEEVASPSLEILENILAEEVGVRMSEGEGTFRPRGTYALCFYVVCDYCHCGVTQLQNDTGESLLCLYEGCEASKSAK